MANVKMTKTSKTAGKAKKLKFEDLPAQSDPKAELKGADLLAAAQPVLAMLEKDLLARAKESAGVTRALKERYNEEKKAERTADSFVQWQGRIVTQVAASWLLSCVFVRTLEDRGLLGQARIAGPGAMDSQKLFFELSPSLTERDYLLTVFRELSRFPAAKDLFDAQHSLLWKLSPSASAAKELLGLFRTPSAEAPAFRFGQASTRFLGDLYQDLSEDVRKRYALLQTPDFVEEFILDRTLEPAIERFGLDDTTIIDPTCGSGHFLLGSFDRLFEHRQRHEPGIDVRQAAHKALDQVFGADINPYAVAIARFRLTLSYLGKAGFKKISDAPELPLHLVVADSLLHNPHQKQLDFEHQDDASLADWRSSDVFALEDEAAAKDVLHRQYAAVVGNPPYITVKDAKLRDRYRSMYPRSAAGKYSLAAPFCERFFQLGRDRGYVGQITANSFMKREFGKKLIEDYLPSVNLELIVNTSGAYIPGHGTPTVLLFGTHEGPQSREVLSVLAKRGEPSTPADPAKGEVWSSIAEHWGELEFENDYISVANTARDKLGQHPWSLAGGGATELKVLLEERSEKTLGDLADDIGFASFTGLDDAFILPRSSALTQRIEPALIREMVVGEDVRDWTMARAEVAISPYDEVSHEALPLDESARWGRFLWPYRTVAKNVMGFGGKTRHESGQNWWEWYRWQKERYEAAFRITFAFVATHNHFVLDRGGKVFKQSAPIIKLPADATEDDHLALLAYLNSSTACFWMKQVFYPKSSASGDISVEKGKPEANRYEFAGTGMKQLPIPSWNDSERAVLVGLAAEAQELAAKRESLSASALVESAAAGEALQASAIAAEKQVVEDRLVVIQEDIDWLVYKLFNLADAYEPTLGAYREESRPFVAKDEVAEPWRRRAEALASSKELKGLEDPVFKRLWEGRRGVFGHSAMSFEQELANAASAWLQDACEKALVSQPSPMSLRELVATMVNRDDVGRVLEVASLGDLASAIKKALAGGDAVPHLAAQRMTANGLKKREQWLEVWAAQRDEDAGKTVKVAVPPKYGDKDFLSATYWRLRGKLDVPKERFISYPGCESDQDGEPVYGWAGWDHLQRAQTLASLYQNRKTEEGWDKDRLTPMLAGLLELIPWVKQWHNEPNDEFGGLRMGDYFADFLDGECRELGLSHQDLEDWRPSKATRGGKKKAAKKAKAEDA